MHEIGRWLEDVIRSLDGDDPEGMLAVVIALGGRPEATVELLEADLSVTEALDYVAVLRDLGDATRALELVRAVVLSALGMVPRRLAPGPVLVSRAAAVA